MRKTPRTDAVWERFRTDTTGELEPDVEFSTLASELEDELNNALEKIKRLEKAGDALENDNYTIDNLEAWRKAKEAKS